MPKYFRNPRLVRHLHEDLAFLVCDFILSNKKCEFDPDQTRKYSNLPLPIHSSECGPGGEGRILRKDSESGQGRKFEMTVSSRMCPTEVEAGEGGCQTKTRC